MVAYIGGICLLSLGITFSINANLGVSPVSSLGYAFALISPLSIGIATFASNILFIFIQFFLTQKFEFKSYILQLSMSFVMGLILNAIGGLAQILPDANVLWIQLLYLVISLVVISSGIALYLSSGLPMMPYDRVMPLVSEKFQIKFSSAKMICDMTAVVLSLIICFFALGSFGSIGAGTIISALTIGKILGVIMDSIREPLLAWFDAEVLEKIEP